MLQEKAEEIFRLLVCELTFIRQVPAERRRVVSSRVIALTVDQDSVRLSAQKSHKGRYVKSSGQTLCSQSFQPDGTSCSIKRAAFFR